MMNEILNSFKDAILIHKEIYTKLGAQQEKVIIFDDIIGHIEKIEVQLISNDDADSNYERLYTDHINNLLPILSYRGYTDSNFVDNQGEHWKTQVLENFQNNIHRHLNDFSKSINFQIEFFEKIGDFNSNIVLVGANGSGKTSISEKLKEYLNNNGVVISAQRILLLPSFEYINNPALTATKLKEVQVRKKTYKDKEQYQHISSEFEIVIKHLLAQNIASSNEYRKMAIKQADNSLPIDKPIKTTLDSTIEIWNSLIEHRNIDCEDGINIITYTRLVATL